MEADPDVKAAIDILSFALYHENHQSISDKLVPSNNSTDTDRSLKRKRVTDNETDTAVSPSPSSSSSPAPNQSQSEFLRGIKERIWDELNRSGDGDIMMDKLCSHIQDRSVIQKALQEMEEDGRVMVGEGMVFQI